jgi:hypothetical protein
LVRAGLASLPSIVSRARSRGAISVVNADPLARALSLDELPRCVLVAVRRDAGLSVGRTASRLDDAWLFDVAAVFADPFFVALFEAVLRADPLLVFELLLALFFAGSLRLEELFPFFFPAVELAALFCVVFAFPFPPRCASAAGGVRSSAQPRTPAMPALQRRDHIVDPLLIASSALRAVVRPSF